MTETRKRCCERKVTRWSRRTSFRLRSPSISESTFLLVKSLIPQNMRYHFFITHMQAEASGDVGTLYHLFANMGINCWYVAICLVYSHFKPPINYAFRFQYTQARHESQGRDHQKPAMQQGVKDSEAFIVFLTNSYLSRPCMSV